MIVVMPPAAEALSAAAGLAAPRAWQTQPTLFAMIATAVMVRPMSEHCAEQVIAASRGTEMRLPTGATQPASDKDSANSPMSFDMAAGNARFATTSTFR